VIKKERAKILSVGFLIINSPIGFAKARIAINETITEVIMIHILSVRPMAVTTESIEKTMSRMTI
jgi:hypothetical protein